MTIQELHRRKIARIVEGGAPRALDLFAGCGGLSLGFERAGCKIVASVEYDEKAAQSHGANFHKDADVRAWKRHSMAMDITQINADELIELHGLGAVEDAVDIVIGGPPCQSFARVGRAKLREVYQHPEAFKVDKRKDLYLRFLDYVQQLKPIAVLMENVPDVINSGGHNVPEETCELLSEQGYDCAYTLLNASYFGVPQMRERMILIAWSKEIDREVFFPNPTHWIQLPTGYKGTRAVALKHVRKDSLSSDPSFMEEDAFYVEAPQPTPDLPPAITAEDALSDLPAITQHLEGRLSKGARRFDTLAGYRPDVEPNWFVRQMREWPGFRNEEGVYDHVIRHLPRDYPIFARMRPGDQYPEAYAHAVEMFELEVKRLERKGKRLSEAERARLRDAIVPPYDATKFPNKWRKMEADRPARTLMAHIGKDGYSHIHYDSDQARTISVREAARLQSFPDGFVFKGAMNAAFKQIGNAVPPMMSFRLAEHMVNILVNARVHVQEDCYQEAH